MENKEIPFPVFRKYADGRTYFKIESTSSFVELRQMGRFYSFLSYNARNYGDHLMINDMIHLSLPQYLPSTADEFQSTLELWESKFILAN